MPHAFAALHKAEIEKRWPYPQGGEHSGEVSSTPVTHKYSQHNAGPMFGVSENPCPRFPKMECRGGAGGSDVRPTPSRAVLDTANILKYSIANYSMIERFNMRLCPPACPAAEFNYAVCNVTSFRFIP